MSDSQPYRLELSEKAEAAFKRLDKPTAQRISKRFNWLAAHAETYPHVALKGQWSGYYRFRIGNYRAIYRIALDERVIIVEKLGHRRDIYAE